MLRHSVISLASRPLSRSFLSFRRTYCSTGSEKKIEDSEKSTASTCNQSTWEGLGIHPKLLDNISRFGISEPTTIQRMSIPTIIKGRSLIFSSETGTGKTLAYLLPVVQQIINSEEKEKNSKEKTTTEVKEETEEISPPLLRRKEKKAALLLEKKIEKNTREKENRRPKAIILVPNRELALQVFSTARQVCGDLLNCALLIGGPMKSTQAKTLKHDCPEIIVGTPQRILHHRKEDRIYFSKMQSLILDEADVLVSEQGGFQKEILKILHPLQNKSKDRGGAPVQFVAVSATVTPSFTTFLSTHIPSVKTVRGRNTNKPTAKVVHDFIRIKQHEKQDKLVELVQILKDNVTGDKPVMIFCNSSKSCRATDYYLNENGFNAVSLHSGIPPQKRKQEWVSFRKGKAQFLVCSDIAARGLDTTKVGLVVMFDFPKTGVDYLHRAGRTGRVGTTGRVISLINHKDDFFASEIEKYIRDGKSLESLTVEELIHSQKVTEQQKKHATKKTVTGRKHPDKLSKTELKKRQDEGYQVAEKLKKLKKYLL